MNAGILARGELRRATDGAVVPYSMALLDAGWVDAALELQSTVLAGIADPQLVVPLSRPEFERMAHGEGLIAGVLVEEALVGIFGLYFPGGSEENLGRDLGMPPEELSRTAHMEIAYVRTEYRGQGLQKAMMERLLEYAAGETPFRWACATVSPGNMASLATVFSLGCVVVRLKRKYGGAWRYIVLREMARPLRVDASEAVEVPVSDLGRQLELLERGTVGYRLSGPREAPRIVFGRLEPGEGPPMRPPAADLQ